MVKVYFSDNKVMKSSIYEHYGTHKIIQITVKITFVAAADCAKQPWARDLEHGGSRLFSEDGCADYILRWPPLDVRWSRLHCVQSWPAVEIRWVSFARWNKPLRCWKVEEAPPWRRERDPSKLARKPEDPSAAKPRWAVDGLDPRLLRVRRRRA